MSDYKTKAEAYVRSQIKELMELSFGCEVDAKGKAKSLKYVGYSNRQHAIQAVLQDGSSAMLLVDTVSPDTIIGHPIQLQHWLNCLHPKIGPDAKIEAWIGNRIKIWTGKTKILFNLTTGQPATEEDYKAFCEIVGINQD